MIGTEQTCIRAAIGVVKWFDSRKGFGFIIGPAGADVMAHYSKIDGEGFRLLRDGWTVTYDAEKTPKGWKATRITPPPIEQQHKGNHHSEPAHAPALDAIATVVIVPTREHVNSEAGRYQSTSNGMSHDHFEHNADHEHLHQQK